MSFPDRGALRQSAAHQEWNQAAIGKSNEAVFANNLALPVTRWQRRGNGTDLLETAGFVKKVGAGSYALLPLGNRLFNNICACLQRQVEPIGYQNVHLPLLQRVQLWEQSGRLQQFSDGLVKVSGHNGDFVLNPTQEEAITELLGMVTLRRDSFPVRLCQISERVRNIKRPASGLVNAIHFQLAEMYSFSLEDEALHSEGQKLLTAIRCFFTSIGLSTMTSLRDPVKGGLSFVAPLPVAASQHKVYVCEDCNFASQAEMDEGCPDCGSALTPIPAIEVGDMVVPGDYYSKRLAVALPNLGYPRMLFAGLGLSRIMHILAEQGADERGLTFQPAIAPVDFWLVTNNARRAAASELARKLGRCQEQVILDDRDLSFGKKVRDAEMIGARNIVVFGQAKPGSYDIQERRSGKVESFSENALPVEFMKVS